MTMKTNVSSYFQMITLLILLLIPSSYLVDAEIIDYPSFVNGPNSWRNTPSSDFSFWESAGVRPILVNGKFVFGFQCSFEGDNCLIVVSIFKTSSDGNSRFSPQVVWAANRNNPVEIQALLELTSQGQLILKDANDTLVWSPSTASKSISRLTLGSEGNLKLLDKTNLTVWQSFDHPTDVLVLGQKLASGQKLRSSVSPFDSSEGLFAFGIIDGVFTAYIDSDPSQMYYRSFVSEDQSYAEFQTGGFGSLIMAASANFIQLGSDGHLKAYEFKEQGLKWVGTDMLDIDRCSYPLACGRYGVCSGTGCSCPDDASDNETAYFKPNNFTADDGCHAISPISCELSLYHSFLELRRIKIRYLDYILSSKTLQLEDCKEACLQNCSCKAILYNGRNKCLLLSQVFSIEKKEGFDSATTFIKVQSSPIFSQSPSRNPSSPNFPQRKRQNTTVIVGSLLGTIFGVFLIFSFLFLRFKNGFQEYEEDYLDNMLGMPTRFSYEELKNVTNNFSNKLGEGGFGSVFRGILPSGSEVAVKHLVGFGPVNKSFTAEVQTIGSIHHFNLVTLVGFCAEKSNRLLVYEYMANGSLDQWIFNKNQEPALGWQIRKKIILDIAKGLAYLHEECNQKILHLDIKSQNILLDENFNAKVSDFGLSKLIGRDQSRVVTTMRGTPGYMAPEWLSSVITEKVDVYSFGIVVLEILCGRQNFDSSQQEEDRHLVGLFRRKQEMGQLMDLVDKCSDDMLSNAAEVVEMMKVAAWCLQTEYVRRPSMSIVVKLFEGSVDVVGNMNEEDFLNGLTHEAMETFASTVLPSMLSGPR
ncbi:G-type lectin S-receptor-like serine/threonine-protein kinase SD2-5 [Gossypium raimondii]|uniref:Receptor-like serine/threonine-protein kinase n=2 Tax=Gossypium raimondii TaxID=29730 RepID=A0A0D2V8Y9_GOSRA|nr:G-type lectin S-receptor-like serine/threonine-protein kinase SD2-5 [Gossypium raimondii]KJB78599.1 hypothetical protein B456_013G009700 [Gossypium raimondii]